MQVDTFGDLIRRLHKKMKTGYTALTYCPSGGGKTWNSLTLPGKLTMLSTDTSYLLAQKINTSAKIIDIDNWRGDDGFLKTWDKVVEQKPDTIIIDNISDCIDMAVLELIGADDASKDNRQSYQAVYMAIRRLARQANHVGCNVLFLAWEDIVQKKLPDGRIVNKLEPKLPAKIIDSVTGLCNIVGRVSSGVGKDGKMMYWYDLAGTEEFRAKDQVWGRKACVPSQLFTPPKVKGEAK